MKHIYYKNDFAVEITLLNGSGEVIAPPDWQWHIEFTNGRRKYICSVDKGNANVVGNTIMCYLDNHKFCCGEIGYKFVQAIPDINYLDGFQNLITPKSLPIELWEQESDNDINIQSSVVPAYVVYDAYMTAKANGYTGTAEEFYDALNHIVDINKKEADRVEAEANRVTAEQQRVENFVAMESALTTATNKANTATIAAEQSAERANTAAENADVATSNATTATNQATTATKRANDISADLEAKRESDYWRGEKGEKGEKGDDGVSPTVTTSKNGKVTTIEITDANGVHTATVNDGDSVEVVQSTGTSEMSVMSQKAVSDALSNVYTKAESDAKIVLASMGTAVDNEGNNSEVAIMYVPSVGDRYYDTSTGHIKYVKSSTVTEDLGLPSADRIYCNRMTKRLYVFKDGWKKVGEPNEDLSSLKSNVASNSENIQSIASALSTKVDKTDIVQSTGTSEMSVMSQKASTMAFAANTPSGDPMHNLYVEVGAVWNAKTGFWELNGLTDITNEQMLTIYVETNNFLMNQTNLEACYSFLKCRTNIPNIPYLSSVGRLRSDWNDFFRQSDNIEVIVFKHIYSIYFKPNTLNGVFFNCYNLRLIDGILDVSKCQKQNSNDFENCGKLESVKLYKLNYSIGLASCKMLSSESVQYMIENGTDATITITLHPEAYERAIADTGVQTALANKTNVSLAKAE